VAPRRGSAAGFDTPNADALAEPHFVITHFKARPFLMLVSLGPADELSGTAAPCRC
jgi:hypothetical protein